MARRRNTRRSANVTTPSLTTLLTPNPYPSYWPSSYRTITHRTAHVPYRPNPIIAGLLDRRRFRPDRASAPTPATRRGHTRLVNVGTHRVGFAVPAKVAICAKRKIRREVLHAKRRTGKGAMKRNRRRNYWSDITC